MKITHMIFMLLGFWVVMAFVLYTMALESSISTTAGSLVTVSNVIKGHRNETVAGFALELAFRLITEHNGDESKLRNKLHGVLASIPPKQRLALLKRLEEASPNEHMTALYQRAFADATMHRLQNATAITGLHAPELDKYNFAVLVICYNRADYLRRTLNSLEKLDGIDGVTVYISQDGAEATTQEVARSNPKFHYRSHDRNTQTSNGRPKGSTAFLAEHYKDAVTRVFANTSHTHLIIVEDDMEFSPDFLSFFRQTAVLFEKDPTIWCVSSWNDNGFKSLVSDNKKLFRTSFFPGLGWMLRRELWDELAPHFPDDQWDHWMRIPSTHKGRDCVVPEISRNFNFGTDGANMNIVAYNQRLRDIAVNDEHAVDLGDLSYLYLPNYRQYLRDLVEMAATVVPHSSPHGVTRDVAEGTVALVVTRKETFPTVSEQFGIWNEPRAQHQGTGVIKYKGATYVLADARISPYVPESYRLLPHPNQRVVTANQGQTCTAACVEHLAGRCEDEQLEFLNSCESLAQHFGCEKGCGVAWGTELPAYVTEPGHKSTHQCLVTPLVPLCSSRHEKTSRLCACI